MISHEIKGTIALQALLAFGQFIIFQAVILFHGVDAFLPYSISLLTYFLIPLLDMGLSIAILTSTNSLDLKHNIQSMNFVTLIGFVLLVVIITFQWLLYETLSPIMTIAVIFLGIGKFTENTLRLYLISAQRVCESLALISFFNLLRVVICVFTLYYDEIIGLCIVAFLQLWPLIFFWKHNLLKVRHLNRINVNFPQYLHVNLSLVFMQCDRLIILVLIGIGAYNDLASIYAITGLIGTLLSPIANNILVRLVNGIDIRMARFVVFSTTSLFILVGLSYYLLQILSSHIEHYIFQNRAIAISTIIFQFMSLIFVITLQPLLAKKKNSIANYYICFLLVFSIIICSIIYYNFNTSVLTIQSVVIGVLMIAVPFRLFVLNAKERKN